MGGTVAITLRTPEDKVYKMCRWTNIIPWAFNNTKFFNNDKEHIEAILKEWNIMKKDYDDNKETGNFKYPMTSSYFPFEACAPTGYGLVFVDMINKNIYTMQGYTSLNKISTSGISLALKNDYKSSASELITHMESSSKEEKEEYERYKELFECGFLKNYERIKKVGEELKIYKEPVIEKTFEHFIENVIKNDNLREIFHIELNTEYTVFNYENNERLMSDNIIKMRDDIGKIINFTDKEIKLWEERIEECKEYE